MKPSYSSSHCNDLQQQLWQTKKKSRIYFVEFAKMLGMCGVLPLREQCI